MRSTASTVTVFCTPDTDRLVQCPVITTVLDTPLTLTGLSSQASVRFSLIPATLSSVPGGAAGDVGVRRDVEGAGVVEMPGGGPNVLEMVGGELMIDFTPESWCAAKAAMPPARASTPTAMRVPTTHHTRLRRALPGRAGDGPAVGPGRRRRRVARAGGRRAALLGGPRRVGERTLEFPDPLLRVVVCCHGLNMPFPSAVSARSVVFRTVPDLPNRQILLRRRPSGLVRPDDTELVTTPAPEPAEGEALLRTTYVGIDAAARTWLDDQPSYLPPVQLGEVIRAAGIGEVVASRCDAFAVGDVVTTLTGFQEYAIIRDDLFSTPIPGEDDQLAIMSVYGPTGATAYFGMTDIGRPQPGETVVVSAAAGATGSIAGQIAKIAGARVVGIAGGPEKCRAVVADFGFDACIDYKNDDVAAALKQHCPRRVDVYFDNVGGPILDAVLGRLAPRARVVLCGVISSYLTGDHPGPANYVNLLSKTALMQGFNALDQWGRFDEAFAALRKWEAEGRLHHRQTIFEGIESCVDALNGLFTGVNIGKTLVKLSEPGAG